MSAFDRDETILDELSAAGSPVRAQATAFGADPAPATYRALVAAVRAQPDDPEALACLAYVVARRWPRVALAGLAPEADDASVDGLLAEPLLSIDNQPPMPSKMGAPTAPLELRLRPRGTELIVWRPAPPSLVARVREAVGAALVQLDLGHDDPALARLLLTGASTLEELDASADALDGAGAWLELPALRRLALGGGRLGDELAAVCRRLPALTELRVDGETTLAEVQTLAGAALTRLTLWSSACGDPGAVALAAMTSLTELWLGEAGVTDVGARALAGLSQLRVLALMRNAIGDDGVAALATLPRLEYLYLAGNRVTSAGCRALARATTLTCLDLSSNRIEDDGARALTALGELSSLMLVDNPLTDVPALRAALREGRPHLDLVLDEEDAFWQRVP